MALSRPLLYHNVKCSIQDLELLECEFTKSPDSATVGLEKQASVKCQERKCTWISLTEVYLLYIPLAQCEDGDLKLIGGATEAEGRLEVCFNKRWGTIDGDGWTQTDTQVACSQLGYPTSGMLLLKP